MQREKGNTRVVSIKRIYTTHHSCNNGKQDTSRPHLCVSTTYLRPIGCTANVLQLSQSRLLCFNSVKTEVYGAYNGIGRSTKRISTAATTEKRTPKVCKAVPYLLESACTGPKMVLVCPPKGFPELITAATMENGKLLNHIYQQGSSISLRVCMYGA